jgi:D-alanyl-D-alanine carboxypeptidase
LAEKEVDLDNTVCTDHRIRTGIAGASTRVSVGDCATGWDFMGAALVSSDNGAAFAYPMVVDEEMSDFASSMNGLASELGMDQSEFVDSAGIYDENISTARDMTRASIAAAFHPMVSVPASSSVWFANIGEDQEVYKTTNRAFKKTEFLLAKTGFTYTARANFTAVYQEKDGRRIAFTILGAWTPSRRTKDINTIIDWVRRHP